MCSSEKVNEKVSFCIPLLYRSSQKSFQNNALHPNTSRGIFISPCFLDHLPGLGFSQRTWGDVIFQQTISSSCFPSMILGSITCKAYNHHMPDYFWACTAWASSLPQNKMLWRTLADRKQVPTVTNEGMSQSPPTVIPGRAGTHLHEGRQLRSQRKEGTHPVTHVHNRQSGRRPSLLSTTQFISVVQA